MTSLKSTHKILDKKPEIDRYELSRFSTRAVSPTQWASCDFVVAAGLCILQPSTGRVVLLTIGAQKTKGGRWFLPRGRKDIGESLEATALREGYEESGYRAEFLPIIQYHRQPFSPQHIERIKNQNRSGEANYQEYLCVGEPIYIQTTPQAARFAARNTSTRTDTNVKPVVVAPAVEYIAFWYVGQIPEDAVRELGTGMADEQDYVSHLVTKEEALDGRLNEDEGWVVYQAYDCWERTESARKEWEAKQDQRKKDDLLETTKLTEELGESEFV